MRAELVIDLNDVGDDVGRALGREVAVFPSLGKLAEMWELLGVDVTVAHIVAPGLPVRSIEDDQSFGELHTAAWWKTESVFLENGPIEANLSFCALGEDGSVGLDALVVATALHRSDALADADEAEPVIVIVMSNSPGVAPAVTHARGVPVMIAGTVIPHSGLAHARLELSWMSLLSNRFAALRLDDVELRNGRPWSDGVAVCTPFDGTEGRDSNVAVLPSFAESVALFDPEHFQAHDESAQAIPDDAGLASVIHALGLGTLVHIDHVGDRQRANTLDTQTVASLYRYAFDHPDVPIVVASARPSTIAATSDLEHFHVAEPDRVLRLCLPKREISFDEESFSTSSAACRIVIERSLTEPLLAEDENAADDSDSGRHLTLIEGGENSVPIVRSISPTLVLYTNPNTVRDDSKRWRHSTQRRFLLVGASGADATPADSFDGSFLPVSLGGCADFSARGPALRPGCVVEGILHASGERWIVVSDPIERRRLSRAGLKHLEGAVG
ncbi:MAG: hypothetical protein ACI81L_003536 [Verrucomicrobiales bacterium]|jgi:hypothetical protein